MPYPHAFIKVSFGGSLAAGQEIWTNGINFGLPNASVGFETGDFSAALSNVAADVEAWYTDTRMTIPQVALLEWVKIAYIGENGEYFRDADVYDYATPVPGSRNYIGNLTQQSTVVTFESARRRTPGRFARIYPPMTGSVSFDGYVALGEAEGMRDATVELLESIADSLQTAGEQPVVPIVASQRTEQNHEITTVKVGRIIDVQRRRRNRLPELYTAPAPVEVP